VEDVFKHGLITLVKFIPHRIKELFLFLFEPTPFRFGRV